MGKPLQLVLIDETGDPGFKLDGGSSPIFAIGMVIFSDFLEAEKTSVAIKQLRRDIFHNDHAEFKFSKIRPEFRHRFFEAMAPFDFTVRVLLVEKEKLRSKNLKSNKGSFYNYFVKMLLKHNKGTVANASVKIDGSGDREFKRKFCSYLSGELNAQNRIVEKIKFADSRSDVLIQLADMVVGCVRRCHESENKEEQKMFALLKPKISDIWKFE
ncbi:MAG: hypothetical protein A3C93_00160 [Candidatus Lloydbacteria bacterium RIFCSPHIGHO2_02_FULL_54_17]|uniref:DUF3800 domain-containing protein n=1 Tax=Candidatus Lloydbacteria bacterium RIFCSPHIGHO2_02_FULL_54_17 TaxID=1798664 RepID=A0A1G2DIC4_9BACT|nr:MAG: hypothetical protein A2762_03910 [Candidatus Lloydbacteria bacterium RIFCSPHIGHO2_01_FULL_54_11]OGZ13316.1 MAG: hypothetical protein A3C93_00160 [Candidatus Lloydbacteria bacterium RIFCSPHIGHO2_02_FULL_54_17]OGZ17124.1 MAG: hypothetical protein A3H76_02960 [Candidatus Lloydbacteria bacterium RIFCSPLOWO2_02_FULL_54_12]